MELGTDRDRDGGGGGVGGDAGVTVCLVDDGRQSRWPCQAFGSPCLDVCGPSRRGEETTEFTSRLILI